MNAFIKFNKGIVNQPVHLRLWVMALVIMNLIAPLFFLNHLEGWVVIGAFLVAAVLMTVLTSLAGFTRLLGLGHILWFPLTYFLWTRLGQIPADDLFGIWIRTLILLNAISLIMDVTDVIRYITGDRAETVNGLT